MSTLRKVPEIDALVKRLEGRARLLVICLSHSWGGLEQVAAQDSADFGSLGLEVKVLCLEGTPIHENLAHRADVEVVPLGFRPRNYFDLRLRHELHRLLNKGISLIHLHQPSLLGSVAPWLWGKYPKVPLIATRHIMSDHNKKDIFHWLIYSRLDALVVMSRALKKNILETHPVRESTVKAINLGLDFDRFDPKKVDSRAQRALWGADEETVVIGMVGRIDPAKGQATFINAVAGLLKGRAGARKLKFVIVGEETLGSTETYLDDLRKMVKRLGLEEYVVFAGYQEDIPRVMSALDIFVMPSRQEAFGLVAIEAMAMECPILISAGGSAEEIIGDSEYGVTIKPNDAFDLQGQLRNLLEHPLERSQMGRRGREHVKRSYDRLSRVRKTLELYDQVLTRRNGAC